MSNSKQRLLEVMSKVDDSFKPKLNESDEELNQHDENITKYDFLIWDVEGKNGIRGAKNITSLKDVIDGAVRTAEYHKIDVEVYLRGMNVHNYIVSSELLVVIHGGLLKDAQDKVWSTENPEQNQEQNPEQSMNEMPNWGKTRSNPAYTHFAVLKTTGKIVNGWDYKGYDQAELRADKKYYFLNDIKDNQIDPKAVIILTKKYLLAHGTNPSDYANWHKNDTDGTDIYTM